MYNLVWNERTQITARLYGIRGRMSTVFFIKSRNSNPEERSGEIAERCH